MTTYQTPAGYRTPSQMGSREAQILAYHMSRLIIEWGNTPLTKMVRRHMWQIARTIATRATGVEYCIACGQTVKGGPCQSPPGLWARCPL